MQMTDGMMKRLACLIIVSGDDFGDVSNMAQRCNKDAQVCMSLYQQTHRGDYPVVLKLVLNW